MVKLVQKELAVEEEVFGEDIHIKEMVMDLVAVGLAAVAI